MISGNPGKDDPVKGDLPPDLALDDNPDLRLRIGRYLGNIRRDRNISQEQAAKDIKVSRPHLSNIEQGHARTGWKGLNAMARYYSIGIQDLIDTVEREMPVAPEASKTGLRSLGSARIINERNTTQILSDDESFVIHIWRALSAERQNNVRKLLADLVHEQVRELGKR